VVGLVLLTPPPRPLPRRVLSPGLYGLAVLGCTRAVKLVSNLLGAAALILIGGGMLVLGYASGVVGHSLVSVGIAAVLVGGGFAFMHSTLHLTLYNRLRSKIALGRLRGRLQLSG
jgi:hypothetical protein